MNQDTTYPARSTRCKFSVEVEQQIRAEYEAGATSYELAEKHGSCQDAIIKAIRRAGGTMKAGGARKGKPRLVGRTLTPEQEMEVRREYESGIPSTALAKKWGFITPRAVTQVIIRNGGTIRDASTRTAGRKSPHGWTCLLLNEGGFANVENDPEAAYFAGFLFADGCITEGDWQPAVTLVQAERDLAIVEAFRSFLGSTHKIRRCKNSTSKEKAAGIERWSWHFTVHSRRIVDDLAKLNIVPRKSLTATVPESIAFNRHWWRGVIDGDGHLGIGFTRGRAEPRLGLVGTRQTCLAFLAFVESITPAKVKVHLHAHSPVWHVQVGGKHAIRIAQHLYRPDEIALERKQELAERMTAMGIARGWLKPIAVEDTEST